MRKNREKDVANNSKAIRADYARDGDPDWEENFYILRHSLCPAVLTENFFMDSPSDQDYLQSEAGKRAIMDTHIEGITKYLSFYSQFVADDIVRPHTTLMLSDH